VFKPGNILLLCFNLHVRRFNHLFQKLSFILLIDHEIFKLQLLLYFEFLKLDLIAPYLMLELLVFDNKLATGFKSLFQFTGAFLELAF
jgi:hypothetical protein